MKYQLDPNSSKPLHVQAEEMLRELIRDEEYKKGKLLPNEVDLSKELNISRNTLRQAINKLVFEGLLIRKKRLWNDCGASQCDEQRKELEKLLTGNESPGNGCAEFRTAHKLQERAGGSRQILFRDTEHLYALP